MFIYIYSLYMQVINVLHYLIVSAAILVTIQMICAQMVADGSEAKEELEREEKKVKRSWR